MAASPEQVLWTFSIYLEAVAILPQLFLLQRTGTTDNLSAQFIFCLGMYRGLYLLNWIFRWFTEPYVYQLSLQVGLALCILPTPLCCALPLFVSWIPFPAPANASYSRAFVVGRAHVFQTEGYVRGHEIHCVK